MEDGAQAPTPAPKPSNAIHPKVAYAVFAGAVVNLLMAVLKAKAGIDLTAYQPDLLIIVGALVGWYAPSLT